jgi:hypothetical protein
MEWWNIGMWEIPSLAGLTLMKRLFFYEKEGNQWVSQSLGGLRVFISKRATASQSARVTLLKRQRTVIAKAIARGTSIRVGTEM